jgi:hypothetical protein
MSRVKKLLPKGGLEKIRDLASRGHSEKDIARALGISPGTWTRIKSEDPAAQDALDEGRCKEHEQLFGTLFHMAVVDKNLIALIFLLKARHSYSDSGVTTEGRNTIVINLPGALPMETYAARFPSANNKMLTQQKEVKRG